MIEAGIGAELSRPCTGFVALFARPEIEVKHNFQAELQAPRPHQPDLIRHAAKALRKMLDRRIFAVQPCHPNENRASSTRTAHEVNEKAARGQGNRVKKYVTNGGCAESVGVL